MKAVSKGYFTRYCEAEARSKTSLRGAQRRSKPLIINIWIASPNGSQRRNRTFDTAPFGEIEQQQVFRICLERNIFN
ncbi:MAG: hypothetical protein LBP85_00660 [Prevotellaceae bacterium]|jgi:hypothetical protein|nr:hypothetical protein [Prevotellaceae bacterium]